MASCNLHYTKNVQEKVDFVNCYELNIADKGPTGAADECAKTLKYDMNRQNKIKYTFNLQLPDKIPEFATVTVLVVLVFNFNARQRVELNRYCYVSHPDDQVSS